MSERFAVINVVWGVEYTKFLMDVSLPTFLSPGNLGFLSKNTKCVYRLYTTTEDEEIIRCSPSMLELMGLMDVQIVRMGAIQERYATASATYRTAVQDLKNENTVILPVSPDLLLADGGFKHAFNLYQSGKKAALIVVPRISKEDAAADLLDKPRFTPRELADLAIRFPHPQAANMFWDENTASFWPSHIHFAVGDAGFLTRPWHVHPFFIALNKDSGLQEATIDSDMVLKAGIGLVDIAFIADSDDACMVEVSSNKIHPAVSRHPNPVQYIADWAKKNANWLHRSHVRQMVRFHSQNLDASWLPVEEKSEKVVQAIMAEMQR